MKEESILVHNYAATITLNDRSYSLSSSGKLLKEKEIERLDEFPDTSFIITLEQYAPRLSPKSFMLKLLRDRSVDMHRTILCELEQSLPLSIVYSQSQRTGLVLHETRDELYHLLVGHVCWNDDQDKVSFVRLSFRCRFRYASSKKTIQGQTLRSVELASEADVRPFFQLWVKHHGSTLSEITLGAKYDIVNRFRVEPDEIDSTL